MRLVQWHSCARCQHKVLCMRVCVHVSMCLYLSVYTSVLLCCASLSALVQR